MSKEADDKERLAGTFDKLHGEAGHLLSRTSKNSASQPGGGVGRGGHEVWSGPAADRFVQELQQAKSQLDKLPGGFSQTAKNLRDTARELREQEKKQKSAP